MLVRTLIIIFFPVSIFCQNTIGLPYIINYNKEAYNAGLQNWDIKQDKNGIIYIANNEGLLSFDGRYWKLYPLPNKTIVRSVEIGSDNRIYVGGQDEFGYFAPSKNGKLQYHSLVSLLSEKHRAFADVWDISSFKNSVFFRTSTRIFKLTNESVSVFSALSEWTYMGVCHDKIYGHDLHNGLLSFENNVWVQVWNTDDQLRNLEITSILPLQNDSIVLTTLKNGIYILSKKGISKIESANSPSFEKERIYSAIKVNSDWIALASTNGGITIVDSKGNVIQNISKTEGIQNNNVLSIFLDKQSNLWLGLDNGIDCVAFNSAIKRINPFLRDGSGYTAIIYKNYLYIGTSSILFSVPLQTVKDLSFSRGTFSSVINTTGQTWSLAEINGKLLLGHHEGAFVINGNVASSIFPNLGFWNFTPMSSVFPSEKIIAGNYRGLAFFVYKNNVFSKSENIPGFTETSRFVAIDKYNNIWVSHPYHGVYKVTPAGDTEYKTRLYTEKDGLPSTLNNHIYIIKSEVVVATEKGIYNYNSTKDIFEPFGFYKKIFGEISLRYLKEDADGNIWFVHEKDLGVLEMSGNKPEIIYIPELNNKILSGFEFVYPVNENNVFIGGEKGIFHVNYEKYKKNLPELKTQIRTVRIVDNKDSLLFGGYFNNVNENQIQDKKQIPQIANNWKTIHFEFSSPLFGQQSNLEYSYRLRGFNENWAEWSNKTEKEYTNLPAGSYTFEIKAHKNSGVESSIASFSFKILPPWYQTSWAYSIYLLLFCFGVYFLYRWQRKKFYSQQIKYEEEQKRIRYLHQLEMDNAENELIALRNEKLQAEIDFKNSELANTAMHLVHKSEIMTKIKTELNQTMKTINNEKGVAELKKMIKVISEDNKIDKDWEHFAQHFDRVHSDFIVTLKEKYPSLTINELKLCAYLRMNLSSKEIAQLLNISVRGVEISRYRLRKKLVISTETSLFDFLIQIRV